MSDFVVLGEIANIKGGKRLPVGTSLQTTPNMHPYIRVRDLNNVITLEKGIDFEYVDDETQRMISRYIVTEGDIILSIVGTIGLTAIIGSSLNGANLTENCVKITNFHPLYNRDFIFYYLRSHWGQNEIRKGTVGAVQAKLPLKNIAAIQIPKISLQAQEQIACLLSTIDKKIELNAQINHNLEEQAKAIFKSWFVDFEPFRDGKFVDSELGKIPQGWKVGSISDLGNIVGGSTPSKSKPEYYTSSGIPWITPKDLSINKSKFISHGEIDITPIGLKNSSTTIMPQGTVLFSSRAPIGYIAIAKNEISTNQGFKSIVPFEHIGTSFVYCFLKENLFRIESMASGSTFKEVSGSIMKGIPAIVPDSESLKQFSNICNSMFMEQKHRENEIHALEKVRDSLLPKLMSGEIDVSEVEI